MISPVNRFQHHDAATIHIISGDIVQRSLWCVGDFTNDNHNFSQQRYRSLVSSISATIYIGLHASLQQQITFISGDIGQAWMHRATPKGVLRVMGVQGLTIYHVKSHLQKYRLAKYLPESSSDGTKVDKKESDLFSNLDAASGMQITEALKLQMEVQKRLQEQLEVQRQLQLRIEAQGKYLKKIIEEQQRLSGVLAEGSGLGTPAAGPDDHSPEYENKNDPSTPAPTSEAPLQDKASNDFKERILHDESFSRHEPLTPDSGCRISSPAESSQGESNRPGKRHQVLSTCGEQKHVNAVSMEVANAKHGMVLSHKILDSSSEEIFLQHCSVFPVAGCFDS